MNPRTERDAKMIRDFGNWSGTSSGIYEFIPTVFYEAGNPWYEIILNRFKWKSDILDSQASLFRVTEGPDSDWNMVLTRGCVLDHKTVRECVDFAAKMYSFDYVEGDHGKLESRA